MNTILKPILLSGLAVVLAAGCRNGGKAAADSSLAERLEGLVSDGRIMYGHQDDLMYGHSWNANTDGDTLLLRSDVLSVSGSYPAMLGLDLGGIELGDSHNLDGNSFDLMRRAAVLHHERGGIITLSWHLRNPLTGGDAWDHSDAGTVQSVLPGGSCHQEFLTWMDRLAEWIRSVKTADGKPVEMIFRPWHEHSGRWFWWGLPNSSCVQYISLWRMTYDYLVKECGISNLLWAISPNFSDDFDEILPASYPGDEYVDIIGLDYYAGGNNYVSNARKGLASICNFAAEHGKLAAFTETGLESLPDSAWWTGELSEAMEGFPICYVLTWRNASDKPGHFYAPFPGQGSSEDFKAWSESGNVEFLKIQ